jgi:transposase
VRSIGLDVHRDFCEVAIAEAGEVRSAGRIETTPATLELFAQSLCATDRVVLEVTGNAWEVARILEPHVGEVLVVHPGDTGIRQARAKTDRLDARALAKLLAAGSLDGLWMPDEQTRALRRRLARRSQLVRARTRAKNECHAALARRLIKKPGVSDLFGQAGREWLREVELPVEERETVDGCLRQIEFLDAEITEVEKQIARDALGSPQIKRLMTVPGVNVIVAATFLAAVGDVSRFPGQRQLVGYLGLDPRVRQSGSTPATHGRISKQGSASARHALVEAAWSVVRQPGPLRAFYQRIRARRGHQVAVGRRGTQARLPVLVHAHPRRGLRLRPAVADQEEAPPARAHRRRPALPGRPHRLVDKRRDASRRARARPTGGVRLPAHRRRLAIDEGRERDTGTRITKALEGQPARQGIGPKPCALARRRPRPTQTLSPQQTVIKPT